jgi:hypothetical protein
LNYGQHRNYPVVVMPIKYGPVRTVYQEGLRRLTATFPDELKGRLIFEDVFLANGRLQLNVARFRPTLERVLTDRVCEMGGVVSQIFAGSRLELEHRPRLGYHYPKAIMTTGAVTHPSYPTDNLGQMDRTGEVAVEEHQYAAIVVEFERDVFHFRQLLSNKRGEFYDIHPKDGGAYYYSSTGYEHQPDAVSALVLGDWHTGKTDKVVREVTFTDMVPTLSPNDIVLHDFADCESVNFFDDSVASRRAHKAEKGWSSLEWELNLGINELKWMREYTSATLHIVAANHNGYISDYVERLKWRFEDENLYIGAKLFVMLVDDLRERDPEMSQAEQGDAVQLWIRSHNLDGVEAHSRKDELLLPKGYKRPVLVSMHGDIGLGGKHTRSMKAFRQMNARMMIGHTHSGAIFGPIWRVGVSTPRTQSYVATPATNWTNTHGVIFKNGQRQLLNIVKGGWHGGHTQRGKKGAAKATRGASSRATRGR